MALNQLQGETYASDLEFLSSTKGSQIKVMISHLRGVHGRHFRANIGIITLDRVVGKEGLLVDMCKTKCW